MRIVVREQRQQVGDAQRAFDLAVHVDAADVQRRALLGVRDAFDRGELGRLLRATCRAAQSPTTSWTGTAIIATVSASASPTRW